MKPYLIHHLMDAACERTPGKACVADKQGAWSYEEIRQRAMRLGGALLEMGVKPGHHVGVLLDRSVEQVTAILGLSYAGAVLVIINPILKNHQIQHILRDAQIETVVTSHSKIKKTASILTEGGVKSALVFDGRDDYGLSHAVKTASDCSGFAAVTQDPTRLYDDTSHIIYTSGSTGQPKGIVISHRNTLDGGRIVSHYTGLLPDDKILGALPFNFDYGFNQLINSLHVGATLFIHHFLFPNDLLKVVQDQKITVFAGMTPIWAKIFDPKLTDLSRPWDFSHLRVITNTGGKVPVSTVKAMRTLFPQTRIFLMYGLTEAFRSTFLDPEEIDGRPDSMGKAIPNVQIMVLDKNGNEVGPDEEGELVHRGALISKGYWNNAEKTARVFRPNPALGPENAHLETVVFSGDIVRRDAEGFLYYVGRTDHMIKTKGYRVSPTEVEELMKNMDGIVDCVAAGYEDDAGIHLRIFLVLQGASRPAEEILKQCKREFPFYLVPDDVVICPQFPLTPNGKVDRNRIIREHDHA